MIVRDKVVPLLIVLITAISCSSPVTQNYYILGSSQKSQSIMVSGEPAILIRSIRLPSYLNETGIVRQVSANKVEISLTSHWVESFSQSLPQILAKEIETNINKPVIVSPASPGYKTNTILEVNISQFIANDRNVLLSAKYRLISDKAIKVYNFYKELELQDQEIETLVDKHEELIQMLSYDISDNYNKL